jgi:hypothetical protein
MATSKTGERLMKIETDLQYIKTDISEVKQDLREFIIKAPDKFASKAVEGDVISLVIKIDSTNKELSRIKQEIAKYIGFACGAFFIVSVGMKFFGF